MGMAKYASAIARSMRRRLLAWSETAILFAGLYVGLPLLGRRADDSLGLPAWPDPVRWTGVPLLALGLLGLGWSLSAFARVGGTPNPVAPPPRLVTAGPFAWTRNPIILSHFFGALGASLIAGSVIAVLVIFLLSVPSQGIVRHEERNLEARFGDDYRVYAARVPRWVPRRARRHR